MTATRRKKTTQQVALTSFVAKGDGDEEHLIRQGETYDTSHPVVKKHPGLFGEPGDIPLGPEGE